MEGELLCYIGSLFNGGRMVQVTEVASLIGGRMVVTEVLQFNRRKMVMLQRWLV